MAKQTLPLIWVKTFGIVSFYERCGVGCVRMKSSLTGKRWRSDPAFEGSRRSAACMALASPLASAVYQTIPKHQRLYPHYKQLVGIAQQMLCAGYSIIQVKKVLRFTVCRYLRKLQAPDPNRRPVRSPFAATLSLKIQPALIMPMPHPVAIHLSAKPTLAKSVERQLSITVPQRGSPACVSSAYNIKEVKSAGNYLICLLNNTSDTNYSKWQGRSMPISAKSACISQKEAPQMPLKRKFQLHLGSYDPLMGF